MLFGTKGGNSSRDLANLMRYDESLRDHTREISNANARFAKDESLRRHYTSGNRQTSAKWPGKHAL